MTIVTGAGGWLGRAMSRELATAPERVRLSMLNFGERAQASAIAPNAEVLVGNLLDSGALEALMAGAEGADIIHAASVIHPAEISDFERINVGITRSLVEAAVLSNARRFIYVSSNSPFGFNPTSEDVFRSNDAYSPYLGYGRSKMEAEMITKTLAETDVEFVIIRPPWFYGGFQPQRQSEFFSTVRKGRFPVIGDGSNLRSMVSVESLAAGIRQAQLSEKAAGRCYWLADAEPYTFLHVVETLKQALEMEGLTTSARIPRVPHVVPATARLLDKAMQRRGQYSQSIHVLGELDMNIACSPREAEIDFGFVPSTDLLYGLRRSIAWALASGAAI